MEDGSTIYLNDDRSASIRYSDNRDFSIEGNCDTSDIIQHNDYSEIIVTKRSGTGTITVRTSSSPPDDFDIPNPTPTQDPTPEPTPINFGDSYDNRLKSNEQNILYSSTWSDVGKINDIEYRNLIWFNLSEYNSSEIESATLSMFWYYENIDLVNGTHNQ